MKRSTLSTPLAQSPAANCFVSLESIFAAKTRLKGVAIHTPLQRNENLSTKYDCNVFLKREDLQVVRSYKIRGAYNKIASLSPEQLERGVVCASAGNHAQGVAFACRSLGIVGKIFMPVTTPQLKVRKAELFGGAQVQVVLVGDTFDDAFEQGVKAAEAQGSAFIHPFDDREVIAGQGTVGTEILEDLELPIDYVFLPVGGGGLAAGLGSALKQSSPGTQLIGVEPSGAPAMHDSLQQGRVVHLSQIDTFVDGAAVKQVGELTFRICQQALDRVTLVPEGKVCSSILQLYNEEGIIVEPAGALSIAALDTFQESIRHKNVVCVVSGSNNDIARTEEIKERSLLYEGLKHYFILRFPQRAGALREFLNNVLGPTDDITYFEYIKKHNRESGPALVGIQVQRREDSVALMQRMNASGVNYQTINDRTMLFEFLV